MSTAAKKAIVKTQHGRSDTQLIAECLKGKETAWSALIDKYKNLIFSIPLHYGFPEEDAADIFQAVCMDLLAELPRLREPKALGGWLIQVTRNKCFHRKQSMLRHKVLEIGEVDLPTPAAEPDNLASQIEQEQHLQEAMADLSHQCQQLIHMLFFETPARAYDEIAKELHFARGSIGFARRNCLDKLKERLERLGH
jgi:RNA polymerase sigma factor (sigma-70 family)